MKSNSVFFCYFKENRRIFIKIILFLILGIILGIICVNNSSFEQINEITAYMQDLINNIKNAENINKSIFLVQDLKKNTIFVIIIWIMGLTIIGNFFLYVIILYKGFSLGYTISAVIAALGIKSGIIFASLSLIIPNLIFIPAIILLTGNGIKIYQSIKQNKYVNIKGELIRYTVFMLITLVLTVISTYIEASSSMYLLEIIKKI